MCEPAAVALHSVGQGNVQIGDTVAVFGAGPIGIMLALWSKTAKYGITDFKATLAPTEGENVDDRAEQTAE